MLSDTWSASRMSSTSWAMPWPSGASSVMSMTSLSLSSLEFGLGVPSAMFWLASMSLGLCKLLSHSMTWSHPGIEHICRYVCGIQFSFSLPVKLAVFSCLELNKCMCTLKNPRNSNFTPLLNFLAFYRNSRIILWLRNHLFCQSRVMDTHAPITLGKSGGFKLRRFELPSAARAQRRRSGRSGPQNSALELRLLIWVS
jgi:hypothetical protein